MNAIYGLAGSFVGIFVPIYLLRKNLDPANVFWFYLVFAVSIPVFFFLSSKIVRAIGLRKTVLLGYPFLFLYFFLLYNLDRFGTPLAVLAIVNGFQVSLYWFPLHVWLSKTSHAGAIGNVLGKFYAAAQFVSLLAPIAAAFIVLFFGFKMLFVFTAVIYLASAVPVLYLPEISFKEKMMIRDLFKLLKKYPHYIVAEMLENLREEAEGVIWPVFVYLAFRNILSIGYIGAASGVGLVLFDLLVGKYADKIDKRKLLGAGALVLAMIWILRLFFVTPLAAYALTVAASFFGVLAVIPLTAMFYGNAKRESAPTFIIFRELGIMFGRVILYAIAFLVIGSMNYIFIFAALICLGLFFLSKKNIESRDDAQRLSAGYRPVI